MHFHVPVPRLRAAAALVCALATGASLVHAAPLDIDLPAQPLPESIKALGRAAGLTIAADSALLAGRTAPGIRGRMEPADALARMLAGSGLEAVLQSNGSWLVRRVPVPPAAATTALPAVTVTAATEPETATGPVRGYAARRSGTGTKTDTPLMETPQSISIVGAEEIEVLKSQNLQDALGYVAGVSRSEGLDRTSDTLIVRGFQLDGNGNQYRDGTKYTVNIFNGQQEPYGLERIELLKGAASVLYGSAAPGGIINTVSKRPTATPLRELNVEFGSFSRKQVSGDFGGPLGEAGDWSYRLTFLKRDSKTFVDYTADDRVFIAPALKWQPDAATSLTLLADYQKDRSAYVYGLPEEGTILPNVNGKFRRSLFVGEPGYDQFRVERFAIGYLFEHAFDDRLKLRNSLRYMKADNQYASVWISGLMDDQRTTAFRGVAPRWDRSSAVVSDTSLQYAAQTGPVRHTLLVGLDYSAPRHESERYQRSIGNIDLYAPVYGSPFGAETTQNPYSWKSTAKRMGLYAQDQMKIGDRWVVLVGGRHDSVRYDERSFFTGEKFVDNERDHAFTGRAGLVYLADNGWAPFLSYSESFEPTSGKDRLGARFKPTTGRQYEAGVRYQPQGANTVLSAAVYQLTRQNVLVADPQDPSLTYSIQQGEVRSRGVEIEARTAVGRNANLILAYAYTDAVTTKASALQPEQEGLRSPGVPHNQLSVWGDYNFGRFGLPGLKAGAGMRHVGSTRSQTDHAVPAFTLFDAMVSYATGPWRFALNVNNLTDKTYIGNCTYGCFYGEPRRAIASATYRW
ncbi:MAG TPA: TonB-dependent siderophore receptor [Pseudorhodoferax sp.]|nr:TonB-dependent siderophore receptor [Pseudorhodoferax sp.]